MCVHRVYICTDPTYLESAQPDLRAGAEKALAFVCVLADKLTARRVQKLFLLEEQKQLVNRRYSWIAHELQIGTSLGKCHNLVQFQI